MSELEQVISKVSIALRKSSGKDKTGNIITARMLTDKNQLRRLLTTDQGYKFMTPPYWQAILRDLMASTSPPSDVTTLPRMDDRLNQLKFKTYQEMYLNGVVALDLSKEPPKVKTIVESNRQTFENNSDEVDEAQELLDKQGPLEDAWALIAPEHP
ncbi:unnamed protein product [Mytilus coruscus]|uniref:Uncharacterized protein n=1 Tax=Mytilus coruscus TaxID=42192 RepID=A0A6J8D5S3_MYTCO|nr:unnamed protein product [Mytilus coruscus]